MKFANYNFAKHLNVLFICALLLVQIAVNAGQINRAVAPGGTATATEERTGFEADKAFDGVNAIGPNGARTTYISSNSAFNPGFLRMEFAGGQGFVISEYTVECPADTSDFTGYPSAWTFEGSNDGVSFTVLDTQTGQFAWSGGEVRNFPIVNSTAYEFYQLNVTANNGAASNWRVGEVRLFENSPDMAITGAAADGYIFPGQTTPLSIEISNLQGFTIDSVAFVVDGDTIGTDTVASGAIPNLEYSIDYFTLDQDLFDLSAIVTVNGGTNQFTLLGNFGTSNDLTDANLQGAATASSDDTFGLANEAFDGGIGGENNNPWTSEADGTVDEEFVTYEFLGGGTFTVEQYGLTPRNFVGGSVFQRFPSDFTLQGSTDGISFTVIDTVTTFTITNDSTGVNTQYLFDVDSPGAYSHYRLSATNNQDGIEDQMAVGDIQLFPQSFGNVDLTSPSQNIIGGLGATDFSATITQSDNTVVSVDFYAGGALLANGADQGGGVWTANASPTGSGILNIVAVATDNLGNTFVSDENISVVFPLFVTTGGNAANSGSSFADPLDLDTAMSTLQNSGGTIFMFAGTYDLATTPTELNAGISVYGSFNNIADDEPSDRPAIVTPTTIIDGLGNFRAFTVSDGDLLLDGLWIEDNTGNNMPATGAGAVRFVTNANNLTINDCRFTSNSATNSNSTRGGAIRAQVNGSATITNSSFEKQYCWR